MGEECCVVLDVGKTTAKLCAVDAAGAALRSLVRSNPALPGPPYPHLDLEGLWDWLLAGLRTLVEAGLRVEAIVVATHGAAAALLGQEELALPLLDYEFAGISELDDEYERAARDFARTLSPRLPAGLNLGRQLVWLRRRFPREFERVTDVLLYPQYWAWRLCGRKASEVTSLGCHTDLWEPARRDFSSFARASGLAALFPPLVPAWTRLGSLLPPVARATGLPERCELVAGVHDSNASYLVHRVAREGQFAVVSTGTWVVCMAAARPLGNLRAELDTLANVDAFGDPVATARFMGGREYAALAGEAGLRAAPGADDLRALLDAGALALPAFAAQGGPFRASQGRIEGRPPDSPAGRAALASLYCALMTDFCLDLLDARGDAIVEGSFSSNALYCGTLAALRSPARVLVSADVTGTVTGAALLAHWPARRVDAPVIEATPPVEALELLRHRDRWRRSAARTD